MSDDHGIPDRSPRIPARRAERDVMNAQLGHRVAGRKDEVLENEVAAGGGLRLGGGGKQEEQGGEGAARGRHDGWMAERPKRLGRADAIVWSSRLRQQYMKKRRTTI